MTHKENERIAKAVWRATIGEASDFTLTPQAMVLVFASDEDATEVLRILSANAIRERDNG